MIVEEKLKAMKLPLFDLEQHYRQTATPARFISHFAVNNQLYLSGTCAIKDSKPYMTGIVGETLTVEQGYEAARYSVLASLSAIKFALGDLDRVTQAVQLIGYVNSASGFIQQPSVVNGATDLLDDLYGPRGRPTRAAIGCRGLGSGHSVEVVLTVLFSGTGVREPVFLNPPSR